MSPVIRISDESFESLETLAVGFDTPSKVIERLIAQATGKPIIKNAAQSKSVEITPAMYQRAYGLAREVYAGDKPMSEAIAELRGMGMHTGSARDYINNFLKMREGEVFKRTMNSEAVGYYLERILKDDGKEALKKAIDATKQHVDYYESFSNGKLNKVRIIIITYEEVLKTLS